MVSQQKNNKILEIQEAEVKGLRVSREANCEKVNI